MISAIESWIVQSNAQSPMTLSDRLLTLAKDAETAGYGVTAGQLVELAMTVFDEAPRPERRPRARTVRTRH